MSSPSDQSRGARRARRFVVGRTSDIPRGSSRLVTAGGHAIAVFNVEDEFYALLNRCPHRGGPLCHGRFVGQLRSRLPGDFQFDPAVKLVECPWHGWEFDLVTGRSYFDPEKMRARRYAIDVEAGSSVLSERSEGRLEASLVPGPYTADVVPIVVEDNYLVITLR